MKTMNLMTIRDRVLNGMHTNGVCVHCGRDIAEGETILRFERGHIMCNECADKYSTDLQHIITAGFFIKDITSDDIIDWKDYASFVFEKACEFIGERKEEFKEFLDKEKEYICEENSTFFTQYDKECDDEEEE